MPEKFEPVMALLRQCRGLLTLQISEELCEQKKKTVKKCYGAKFLYSRK